MEKRDCFLQGELGGGRRWDCLREWWEGCRYSSCGAPEDSGLIWMNLTANGVSGQWWREVIIFGSKIYVFELCLDLHLLQQGCKFLMSYTWCRFRCWWDVEGKEGMRWGFLLLVDQGQILGTGLHRKLQTEQFRMSYVAKQNRAGMRKHFVLSRLLPGICWLRHGGPGSPMSP